MRTAYNSDKLADGILLQVQYSFLSGGAKSKVDSAQEEGVNVEVADWDHNGSSFRT